MWNTVKSSRGRKGDWRRREIRLLIDPKDSVTHKQSRVAETFSARDREVKSNDTIQTINKNHKRRAGRRPELRLMSLGSAVYTPLLLWEELEATSVDRQ